ncbi:GNAT family N-acetyltransferase [Shewanella baltica]|uniref:GNAT family N-acetyltransferase n=1 Tax=Shewanella baltica TaxID=62322 RepID=UPI003D79D3D5
MEITTFDKNKHDRKSFDCGNVELNNYLKCTSGQHEKKDISRTYVLFSEQNPSQIKGYYTIAVAQVSLSELPTEIAKKYPSEITCSLIGRLAVNHTCQRQGLGSVLLIDAIKRIIQASSAIPVPMIIVQAKNEDAKRFYIDSGFVSFPDNPLKLMMTLANARAMLKEAGH